jgi:DnaJ-class molecular chaperone
MTSKWQCWIVIASAVLAAAALIYSAVAASRTHSPTIVPCSECGGSGAVTYDENHPLVVDWNQEPGTYVCPMCGGEGELERY